MVAMIVVAVWQQEWYGWQCGNKDGDDCGGGGGDVQHRGVKG